MTLTTTEATSVTPRRAKRRRPTVWTYVRRWLLVLALALVTFVAVTLVPALVAPGSDSQVARVAEWAREWGMGALVTSAEKVQYGLQKPTEGGQLQGGIPTTGTLNGSLPPIPARANPALPGEGQWQDFLKDAHGKVTARVAFVRPDATHTAFSVGVVAMDPHALRFALHQGTHVPAGTQVSPSSLTAEEKRTVLATFNSGFQMKDANGGYWQAGTEIAPLVPGAASMVFGRDGSLTIETWPGGTPGPEIAAVRQNLALLVDGGEVTADAGAPDSSLVWGKTLGNSAFVWRSAIGTRADGTVVFIVGPALNVSTLASLAHDAGCQRAMELDINKDWTSYIWYEHKGGTAVPHKLTSDQLPDAGRYLTTSTRDFVAVLPRGA